MNLQYGQSHQVAIADNKVPTSVAEAEHSVPFEVFPAFTVFVVDDDISLCEAMRDFLMSDHRDVEIYPSAETFLDAFNPEHSGCLIVDAKMSGISGIELVKRLASDGHLLPAIVITGHGDVPMAVRAMKAGAADFFTKPIRPDELLASIDHAMTQTRDHARLVASRKAAAALVIGLTERQRQIMTMVLAGHPSKNIASDLGISQRTVENHRAAIMRKTGSKSIPALARLAVGLTVDATSPALPVVIIQQNLSASA